MRFTHLLFLPIALLVNCRTSSTNSITIVGSTSVQPFVEKLAEEYMSKHPKSRINVQGGGSTAGIIAVSSGACNVGMSSRPLKPDEVGFNAVAIAYDAIVVVVHPQNHLRNLSLNTIRDIFAGRIGNWQQLGGPDALIVVVTREEGSGTRGAFAEMVMRETAISDAALVQDSNGAVRELVASDKHAIGYISFGLVDDRIKALAIDGVVPNRENIASGAYSLKRPFLVLRKVNSSCLLADSFISYVLSKEGQASLAEEGLIPLGQ